jgi:type I restriction enzyme S subunit
MEAVDAESGEIVGAKQKLLSEVGSGFTAFQDGDVIWAKITPCMQNGKCALARGLVNSVGYGSTEFHVIRTQDMEVLSPEFLWAILRLRRLRETAQRYFIGSAGQQRVPAEFLRDLPVPIVPMTTQRQIVEWLTQERERVAKLKTEAKARMDAAMADVEAMILGTKEVQL